MHTRFLRPVRYDDLITVTVSLREMPLHHKIVFHGEIHNEAGNLCTSGTVTLYFMEMATKKRSALPEKMRKALVPYFTG
jgi:acyl-CoA thioester hydrolase